jgi:hypothetical protein
MGLLRWLQRKGSTGSIARWAYKGFTTLKAQDSSLTEADICEALFSMRYTMMPPRGNLSFVPRIVHVDQDVRINGVHAALRA